MTAQSEGRLIEMFGAGTAAIVSPVGNAFYGANPTTSEFTITTPAL
jgi:hypothetical protein